MIKLLKMINKNQAIIDYSLNKFCPFIIVAFLLFGSLGFLTWEPYAIMCAIFFIDRFSFKVGYSVAFCEQNNLLNYENDSDKNEDA